MTKYSLDWNQPIPLKLKNSNFAVDEKSVPEKPGIYIFFRKFGDDINEALYVGKTKNGFTGRITGHLNSVKFQEAIREKNGRRYLIFATLKGKRGLPLDTSLMEIERALIRYYLALGHPLINKKHTCCEHSLESTCRPQALCDFIPKTFTF